MKVKELIDRLSKYDPEFEVDVEVIGDVENQVYMGEARSVYIDSNDDTVVISQELR